MLTLKSKQHSRSSLETLNFLPLFQMDESLILKTLTFISLCFIPWVKREKEMRNCHSHCHTYTMLPFTSLHITQHLNTSRTPRSLLSASTQAYRQIHGNIYNQILLSLKEHQNF